MSKAKTPAKGKAGSKVLKGDFKSKASAKAKPKSAAKAKPKSKSSKTPPSAPWWRRLLWFGLKFGLAMLAIVMLWGVYLDMKVQQRFNGDKWQLPATVYGRELILYPGLRLSRQELQTELALLNYRKVPRAKRGGEYAVSNTKIELVRRQFDFADGSEPELPLLLTFSGQRLQKIQQRDNAEDLAQVRLDPVLLERLNVVEQEERIFVPLKDTPTMLIQALLLTEDQHFYQHEGVSPTAILRALVVNLRSGRTVQGGSTITQQLAKNFFLSRERSLWRKAQEAYIALLMEWRYSKEEILESYLNEVYLGQNGSNAIHGIGLASYFYFGVPVSDLQVEQVALLVAIVKGPSYYDPWRHSERAQQRRDLVLRILAEEGTLSADQYRHSSKQELGLVARGSMGYQQSPGFMALVRRELQHYASNWRNVNGIKIFTTLDPISQRFASQAARTQLDGIDKDKQLQTAMVVSERHTGAIRALIGGREKDYQGFNRALDGRRQVGSLVKPFVYLSAFEQGYQLGELLDDSPFSLKQPDGSNWEPQNYDKEFRGPVMMYQALAESLNVPTVRLGMKIGLNSVIKTLEKAGLEQEIKPFPAILLGSFSLSPYQVAQLYQTLADDGEYHQLYAVQQVNDGQGKVLYQAKSAQQGEQRWSEMANYQALYGLQQVTRTGTARSLTWRLPKVDLAGKTGTTNELRDSWYVGIDNREVVTVWVGRDDNKPAAVTGSSAALPIYAAYLKKTFPQSLRARQPDQLAWVPFSSEYGYPMDTECGDTVLLPAPQNQAELAAGCLQQKANKATSFLKKLFN